MTGIPKAEEPVLTTKTRKLLLEFVEAVGEVVGIDKPNTEWQRDVLNFFHEEHTKLVSIKTEFPSFQQSQACYAVNKFIEKHTKVSDAISYQGEIRVAPTYKEIQVTRKETIPLYSRAWVYVKWQKTPMIVQIMFDGHYSEFTVFGLKKDEKALHDFSLAVKKWMKENNFFRGEKLEYFPHGKLGFLDFRKVDWDSVILPKELKDEVVLNIIFPLANKKLCKEHSIPWRRGILLAGIAGTGKTQLARVLCNKIGKGVTVIWATPKSLIEPNFVKLLFDAARYFVPCLLVIEDIDFISKSRDLITDPTVGELLTQLDGSAGNYGIFVLATTNRPDVMDRALIERPSRFDVKLLFDLPDKGARLKMVRHFSTNKNYVGITHDDIARMTTGLTGAYIQEVITYGTLLSLLEKKSSIGRSHIERAIKQTREKLKPNTLVA